MAEQNYSPFVSAILKEDMAEINKLLVNATEEDYMQGLSVIFAQQESPEITMMLYILQQKLCTLSPENLYQVYDVAINRKIQSYIDKIVSCRQFDKNQPGLLINVHSLSQLHYLMRKGIPFPVDQEEKNIMLHSSISTCDLALIEFIINRGGKVDDTLEDNGSNIIDKAIYVKCVDVIPLLLRVGGKISVGNVRRAILTGKIEIVQKILAPLSFLSNEYKEQLLAAVEQLRNIQTVYAKLQFVQNLLIPLKEALQIEENKKQAERRTKAREKMAQDDEKRKIALEEYKTKEVKEELDPERRMVQTTCTDNSQNSLLGDELQDKDEIVVFYLGGEKGEASFRGEARGEAPLRGECYLKSELRDYLDSLDPNDIVYEWMGPPSPFGIPGHPPLPDRTKPVYKLPWSGTWIKGEVLEQALYGDGTIALELFPEKMSIGSQYAVGALHGQWGGHWRKVGNNSEYVESGDAQPDDRELVYSLVNEKYF